MTRGQWLALALGVAAVSWAAPLIRLAEAPVLVVAALRLAMAAPPIAGAALLWRREELRSLAREEWLVLAFAGAALALHFICWVAAVQRTSVVAGVVLVTTQPLFVAMAAWPLLGERPTRALLVAIGVAGLGAMILASSDLGDRGSLAGDALALAGAILAAGYFIAGRRLRVRRSNLAYSGVVYGIAAVVLVVSMLASGVEVRGHPREAYVYIALLALVPQLIGHTAFNWALGSLTAAVVAVAVLGEPVGATLIAATVLDEPPTPFEWVGAVVVLLGVYLALRAPHGAVAASSVEAASTEGGEPWPVP